MDIKKRKALSVQMNGNQALIKAKEVSTDNPQPNAKEGAGLVGLSANLAALKKGKDKVAAAPAENAQPSAKDPGHSEAYKERIKKRAK